MRALLIAGSLVTIVLVACGGDDDDSADTVAGPAASTTSQPPAISGPLTTSDATIVAETSSTVAAAPPTGPAGSAEQQAIADLAALRGVDPAAITTVSVDEVTWRDGSIGCPEPGVGYTQALVNGVRVILEIDGQQFEYHSGGGRAPFLCENPEPPLEP